MATTEPLGRPLLVEYSRPDDPPDVVRWHEWGPGAMLHTEPDGSVRITSGDRAWDEFPDGRRWLINPGGRMAKGRLPPRDSKGRFMKTRSRKRRSRARSRKRNAGLPKGVTRGPSGKFRSKNPDLMARVREGVQDVGGVVGGKVATRLLASQAPRMGLDTAGAKGLAYETLAALLVVALSEGMVRRQTARLITAGALAAPAESLLAGLNLPVLSPAMSPTGLGLYANRARLPRGVGEYVPSASGSRLPQLTGRLGSVGVGEYVDDGFATVF